MKRIAAFFIALLTVCLCVFAGCLEKAPENRYAVPEKPSCVKTEFWIAEDVSNVDFSEYYEIIGWFGAREFYGKGYAPAAVDEDNFAIDPPYYVKYLITAYPDYSDGGQYVTQIKITNPKVEVYGITCESSFDEFDRAMRTHGYEVTILHESPYSCAHTAYFDGNAYINFVKNDSESILIIGVTVTNKNNIVF